MLAKNINAKVVTGLQLILTDMRQQLPIAPPSDGPPTSEWSVCRDNWLKWFDQCEQKLGRVLHRISGGYTLSDDFDGKIISNIMKTIGDFYHAKELNWDRANVRRND